MTRNSKIVDSREQNQRRDVLRRLDYPVYPAPPGYYDPQRYELVEDDRPQMRQRSEGNGIFVFFLIIVLAAGYLFIGKTGSGGTREPGSSPEEFARVAADSLYLRRGPGIQHRADYILPRNWPVSTLGESHVDNDGKVWIRVRVETQQGMQEGWVNQMYLKQ
ncbi:MAG: hypothetical protein AB7U82_18640 [Blastocatellales bacterium]